MSIKAVHQVSEELVESLNALIPQVSTSASTISLGELSAVVNREGTTLFIAELDNKVVGMLTLVTFKIPTGTRAWIEDVVVDESARGLGLAVELVKAGLEQARSAGALTVDLTSRPEREAANALYRKMGFESRETNVYRFSLEG
jgi:ribosomal protein S18 acetylase RimI-like enzyme